MGVALRGVHVDEGGGGLQSQPSELRVAIGVVDEDVVQRRGLERSEPYAVRSGESVDEGEERGKRGGGVSVANDESDREGGRAKRTMDARQEERFVFHSEVVAVDVSGGFGEVEGLRSVEDGVGVIHWIDSSCCSTCSVRVIPDSIVATHATRNTFAIHSICNTFTIHVTRNPLTIHSTRTIHHSMERDGK